MPAASRPAVRLLTFARARRRVADVAGVLTAVLLAAALPPAAAEGWQALTDIEQAASRFVAARAPGGNAAAQSLDARLRLARCDRALETFLRPGATVGRRTIVGVRCTGSRPWKVYVPVNLAVEADVLVLTGPMPRGHVLTAADFQPARRDVSRLASGYLVDPQKAVGQRLRRSLRGGEILTASRLDVRVLVRRGQTVTLEARHSGVSIRMSGKALMDGTKNQRIRVENTSSGRIVEGQVRSAEVVEVLVH